MKNITISVPDSITDSDKVKIEEYAKKIEEETISKLKMVRAIVNQNSPKYLKKPTPLSNWKNIGEAITPVQPNELNKADDSDGSNTGKGK